MMILYEECRGKISVLYKTLHTSICLYEEAGKSQKKNLGDHLVFEK